MTTTRLIELLKEQEKDNHGKSRDVTIYEKNKRGLLTEKVPHDVQIELLYVQNEWNNNRVSLIFEQP